MRTLGVAVLPSLVLATLLALTAAAVVADEGAAPPAAGAPAPDPALPAQFAKVTPRLFRSAQPEGDAAFAAIAKQGVKVIVSVDGARPDVEGAAKHGLRYVHVPIGYEGIPAVKAAVIQKLLVTLEGPFLFHCHHGKHRGPAACALAHRILDATDAAAAEQEMKDAGTAARYAGLFRDVKAWSPLPREVLDSIPAEFPSAVAPAGLVRAMVDVDLTFENVKAVKRAGWKVPEDHPDVAPAHEATILAEALREMARLDETAKATDEFRKLLADGEKAAWDLAGVLGAEAPDAEKAAEAFQRVEASCTSCHAAYRDKR